MPRGVDAPLIVYIKLLELYLQPFIRQLRCRSFALLLIASAQRHHKALLRQLAANFQPDAPVGTRYKRVSSHHILPLLTPCFQHTADLFRCMLRNRKSSPHDCCASCFSSITATSMETG
jgi:hypothetical protein